jgi:hypothetical protein
METTAPAAPRLFGRLGTDADLNRALDLCRQARFTITRDPAAATVEVIDQGNHGLTVLKALRKGPHGSPWLVLYSPSYWPK